MSYRCDYDDSYPPREDENNEPQPDDRPYWTGVVVLGCLIIAAVVVFGLVLR